MAKSLRMQSPLEVVFNISQDIDPAVKNFRIPSSSCQLRHRSRGEPFRILNLFALLTVVVVFMSETWWKMLIDHITFAKAVSFIAQRMLAFANRSLEQTHIFEKVAAVAPKDVSIYKTKV